MKTRIAIDCGANIGVMTLDCARHMQGWASVLAFEIQRRVFYAAAGNDVLAGAAETISRCRPYIRPTIRTGRRSG